MRTRTIFPPGTVPAVTLDKWDIAFIRHFKGADYLDIAKLNVIWGERCYVDPAVDYTRHIVEYLANLIDHLNLTPDLYTTLTSLRPDQAWKVGAKETDNDMIRALYVMASWLRLTEVKYLPGYREAIEHEIELASMQTNADSTSLG